MTTISLNDIETKTLINILLKNGSIEAKEIINKIEKENIYSFYENYVKMIPASPENPNMPSGLKIKYL